MSGTSNSYNLNRFVEAQEPVIQQVKKELRTGQKQTHWMWFIFPQVAGLGSSKMAQRYAIHSRDEAAAYLAHPILGPRLRECTELVNGIDGRSANGIFGSPDDLKFHSSMTLFDTVADNSTPFETALERYFDGDRDQQTLDFLTQ